MLRKHNERNTKSNNVKKDLVVHRQNYRCYRTIANIVISTIDIDKPRKILLLSCNILGKVNHTTISNFFDKTRFSL